MATSTRERTDGLTRRGVLAGAGGLVAVGLAAESAAASVSVTGESVLLTDPRWAGSNPPPTDGTGDWLPIFNALKAYNGGAIVAQGAEIVVPSCAFGLTAPAVVPGTVRLTGVAYAFAGFTTPNDPSRGSRFVALPGFTAGANVAGSESNGLVQFAGTAYPPNANAGTADEDETGGGAEYIVFDCRGLANGPQTLGRRSLIEHCWVVNPLKHCFLGTGQNCRFYDCVGSCKLRPGSDVFWIENWDNKINCCEGRDFTVAFINGRPGCTGLQVIGGTCYGRGEGLHLFETTATGGQIEVVGTVFDDCGDNHVIALYAQGSGRILNCNVDVYVYKNSNFATDASRSILFADANGSSTQIVATLKAMVSTPGSANNFKALLEKSGNTGTVSLGALGCDGRGVKNLWSGTSGAERAAGWAPNRLQGCLVVDKAGNVKRSERTFNVQLTGNGSSADFNVAHGLGAITPDRVVVQPALSAPIAWSTPSKDSTNVLLRFGSPPPAGSFNVYGEAWA